MEQETDESLNISPITPDDARNVAVAIKGGRANAGDTPHVVASGYGRRAEEILAIAFKKGIKVRSDADLAQLLAALDLDSPIPSEAIVAVAEILARVYEANARHAVTTPTEASPPLSTSSNEGTP